MRSIRWAGHLSAVLGALRAIGSRPTGRWSMILVAICCGAVLVAIGEPRPTDPGELGPRLEALPTPLAAPRLLLALPTSAPLLDVDLPELEHEADDETEPAASPGLLPRPRRASRQPGDPPAPSRQRAAPRPTREPRPTATPRAPRATREPRLVEGRVTRTPGAARSAAPVARAQPPEQALPGAAPPDPPSEELPPDASAEASSLSNASPPAAPSARQRRVRVTSRATPAPLDETEAEPADEPPDERRPPRTRTPRTPRPTATPRPTRTPATPAAGLPSEQQARNTATAIAGRQRTPTPRATATRRPTNTPRPTATRRPTRPPTATLTPTATASPVPRPLGSASRSVAIVAGASGRGVQGPLTGKALPFGLAATLPGATFTGLRVGEGDLRDAELNRYDTLVLLS